MLLAEKPRGRVSETRKITKSTMEKKRRARINTSLTELKTILAGIITHKGERFDKMEKADILELTVQYVKQLQKNADEGCSKKDDEYNNGVNSCIGEIIKCIASNNVCNTDIKTRLMDHLANRVNGVNNNEPPLSPAVKATNNTVNKKTETDESLPSVVHAIDANNNVKSNHTASTANTITNNEHVPVAQVSTDKNGTNPIYHPLPTVQLTQGITQTSSILPNMPLTILLPANFCSNGTTCVIPLAVPASSPQMNRQFAACSPLQYGTGSSVQCQSNSPPVQYGTIPSVQYAANNPISYGTTNSPTTAYRTISPFPNTHFSNEHGHSNDTHTSVIPNNRVIMIDGTENTQTERVDTSKAQTHSCHFGKAQDEHCQLEISILEINQKSTRNTEPSENPEPLSKNSMWRPW